MELFETRRIIKILIVDDHKVVTDGVQSMLVNEPEFKIVGKATSESRFFHELEHKPEIDLILLDIELPEFIANGIDLISEVKRRRSNIKVIVLTMHNQSGLLTKALENGADGFILKDNASKLYLAKAIKLVCFENKLFIDPTVKKGAIFKPSKLTKREIQVICLLKDGKNAREIGLDLNISYHTIREYLSNIKNKLGLNKNTLLVKYAIENKICEKDFLQ